MMTGQFLLYRSEDGKIRVECRFEDNTLWLSQAGIAELFQTTKQNVAKHLEAIFDDGELDRESVVNARLTTAATCKDGLQVRTGHRQQRGL